MDWPVYGWANGHQAVKQMTIPSPKTPAELGLGSHLPRGQAPGPQYSACRLAYQYTSPQDGVLD